jgi:hypothetical protein
VDWSKLREVIVLTTLGVAVPGALVTWVRRPGHADRWPILVAATGVGLVVAAANVLAQALGWWGGHWSYTLPAPLRVSFWMLWITPVMTLLLAGYLWLLRHVRRPRLTYGLLGLMVFAPFVVFMDTWALSTGRLALGGGYTIWHDVLVGQAFFGLPVLLYEVARRQVHAQAGEPVARSSGPAGAHLSSRGRHRP